MNLANKLTLARIFLVPIFLIAISVKLKYGIGIYIAAGVFILAASTDGLDGYVARKKNQVTRLGKFMDPLADKLLISAALISLVELREVPAWVAMIIIGREFAITGLRTIAASEGVVMAASKLGKVKTVTQIVAIVLLLFSKKIPFNLFGYPVGTIALWLAVFFTIWSGMEYFRKARFLLKAGAKE